MRNLASKTVLLAIALVLTGCGGSDNNAFVGTGTTGTTGGTTGTGTGTTGAQTFSIGSGTGSAFKSGMLEIAAATLPAGGSTTISASIVDKAGTLFTAAPVTITFNSPCIAAGTAAIAVPTGSTLPAGEISTSTGEASATFTAKGCSGTDVITASASVAV